MSKFAEPMARLIEELKKLPGIGSKSAQRLAFHILRSSEDDAAALAAAIHDVKEKLRLCSLCNNITDIDPASIAAILHATSGWCAWWKSPPTLLPSRRRGTLMASITCCTVRFRRCTESARSICASTTC